MHRVPLHTQNKLVSHSQTVSIVITAHKGTTHIKNITDAEMQYKI